MPNQALQRISASKGACKWIRYIVGILHCSTLTSKPLLCANQHAEAVDASVRSWRHALAVCHNNHFNTSSQLCSMFAEVSEGDFRLLFLNRRHQKLILNARSRAKQIKTADFSEWGIFLQQPPNSFEAVLFYAKYSAEICRQFTFVVAEVCILLVNRLQWALSATYLLY